MKKLKLIFCLFTLVVNSQENLQGLATDYINSQKIFSSDVYQEKFFIHTNKSLYFSGEKIWYKTYVVYESTNTPSYKTSNLHISVYNNKKELIETRLVFVENGKASGFIDLDSSYKTGTYYIVLNTVYGSNFNSKYIKKIEVINLKENQPNFNEKENIIQEAVSELDIEFVPESGLLLGRAYNTVYFNVAFKGEPIEIEGNIINVDTEAEIGKLITNKDGVGSVEFPCYSNKKYVFKTMVNGKEYVKELPLAKAKGFIIHYDYKNTSDEEVFFKISTNNETNKDYLDSEVIYAVIHRKGFLKSVTPIVIDTKYNNYSLKFEKKSLFDGVNTFTIFNNKNKEIANRNFFFNKKKEILLNVEEGKETKDSIQLKISMLNRYVKANSSVSVLTDETKMYTNMDNIRADYLLTPYLDFKKLNPNKILNNANSLKEQDELLQIKTNYKKEIFPIKKEEEKVDPENGISISGIVNTNLKSLNGCKILLTSKENNIVLFQELDNKNTFAFNNLLLLHPSQYKLALLNSAGVVQNAKFTTKSVTTKYKVDSILKYKTSKIESVYFKKNEENPVLVSNVEQLDEVSIFGKKEKKEKISLDSIGYVNTPNELGNGFTKTTKKDPIQCKGCTIFEYLDQIPNIETRKTSEISPSTVVFTNRGINTFLGSNQAYVLIDGAPLGADLSTLNDLYVEDVEFVQINRSGAGYGLKGASGVVNIKLKKKRSGINRVAKKDASASQTEFGFQLDTSPFQYMPLQFSSSRAKMYYDTVDWIPDFTIQPNKVNFINIAKEGNESLKIIINGFNEDGDLLYKEVNINLNTIN